MKKATPNQIRLMTELDIDFDNETTLAEARDLIISELPVVQKRNTLLMRPEIADQIMTTGYNDHKYHDGRFNL